MTNNDLQNITQKSIDGATRIPLTTGGELRCSGKASRFWSTCGTRRVTLFKNPVV